MRAREGPVTLSASIRGRSPLTFGESPIEGAPAPGLLLSGQTYGVDIWLAEECTETGCAPLEMQACAEFVAP